MNASIVAAGFDPINKKVEEQATLASPPNSGRSTS